MLAPNLLFRNFIGKGKMVSKLLVPIKRSGDAPPVFFVPSAGTTALSLVHLARSLKNPHPIYAFEFTELPIDDERPVTVEQLASLCINEIRSVQADGPYFVGGHCWGGVVAFEIAARLEATGDKVARLLLLESVPPSGSEVIADDKRLLNRTEIAAAVSDQCEQMRENLSRLPAEIADRFGSLSWELIDVASHYRANRISARLLLIRTPSYSNAVFQNWNHLTSGSVEEHIIPGDAFSILAAPGVKAVGDRLDEALRNEKD